MTDEINAQDLEELVRMQAEMMADPRYRAYAEDRAEEMAVIEAMVAARQAAGLSQAELAARLGSTQPAIARLEAGRVSPRLTTLRRIARVTGCRLAVAFVPEA